MQQKQAGQQNLLQQGQIAAQGYERDQVRDQQQANFQQQFEESQRARGVQEEMGERRFQADLANRGIVENPEAAARSQALREQMDQAEAERQAQQLSAPIETDPQTGGPMYGLSEERKQQEATELATRAQAVRNEAIQKEINAQRLALDVDKHLASGKKDKAQAGIQRIEADAKAFKGLHERMMKAKTSIDGTMSEQDRKFLKDHLLQQGVEDEALMAKIDSGVVDDQVIDLAATLRVPVTMSAIARTGQVNQELMPATSYLMSRFSATANETKGAFRQILGSAFDDLDPEVVDRVVTKMVAQGFMNNPQQLVNQTPETPPTQSVGMGQAAGAVPTTGTQYGGQGVPQQMVQLPDGRQVPSAMAGMQAMQRGGMMQRPSDQVMQQQQSQQQLQSDEFRRPPV